MSLDGTRKVLIAKRAARTVRRFTLLGVQLSTFIARGKKMTHDTKSQLRTGFELVNEGCSQWAIAEDQRAFGKSRPAVDGQEQPPPKQQNDCSERKPDQENPSAQPQG